MNNRDIIEIQNFNRSVLTKNSYTKSDIEYIIHIYNLCIQSREDNYLLEILNNKITTIVTLAQNQITAFSNGKIHLSPDAYKPMGEFIHQFGKEYVGQSSSLRYEFTPAARRAQIMLNKLNSRLAIKTTVSAKENSKLSPYVSKYNIKTRKLPKTKNSLTPKDSVITLVQRHTQSKKIIQSLNDKLNASMPIIEHQTQIIKHIGNEASEVGEAVYKGVSNIVRRYGAAVALLWGMCGTGNMNDIGAKDVFKNIKEHKIEYYKKTLEPIEKSPKTKVLTGTDFAPKNMSEFNLNDTQLMMPVQDNNLNYQKQNTPSQTIGDMIFKEYQFTKEDLQALEVSEQGAELALHARKVVRNMNYPGYCYRGVKRMFNLANLGEMYGGSAYMAKKYLDNNPNFVRINCNVSDLKYLPKGTVVVFDKGKRGTRPHGHIGVLDEVNGKMVDRSSKTYNVRETLGGYSSVYVYIHADTPLPQRVQENINKIMVLKQKDNHNTVTTDYFTQLAIQQNRAQHV